MSDWLIVFRICQLCEQAQLDSGKRWSNASIPAHGSFFKRAARRFALARSEPIRTMDAAQFFP